MGANNQFRRKLIMENKEYLNVEQDKTESNMNGKQNNRQKNNKRRGSSDKNKSNRRNGGPRNQTKPTNNASMYFTNTELANQAAQFSFSNYLGQSQLSTAFGTDAIPTVLTLAVNPSPGVSDGSLTNGINITGLRTYTRLSAGNAKTTNYAPQDVSTLILAIGEVISMFEVAKRAMRVAYTYNQRNRALPLGIIRATGIDPEFVTSGKIAPLRLKLNYLINSFNQVPILANVSYFAKCAEVYANYYTDSQGMMTQYYVFTPFSTWVLDETAVETGSILKTVPVCIGGHNRIMSMETLLDKIGGMINAILSSSTFNYIFSDILRLCGPSDLLTIPLLSEAESQLPVYDPMKLLQIHNSVAMGSANINAKYEKGVNTPNNDVYPNVELNGLEYYPTLSGCAGSDFIVDFPHSDGNPDLDQKVDATRYIGSVNRDGEGKVDFLNSTLPDHYIVDYSFFFDEDIVFSAQSYNDVTGTVAASVTNLLYVASSVAKFDYHPILHYRNTADAKMYTFGDVDFFTSIDVKYLQRFNDLAFQGLFEFRTNKF